MTDDKRRAITAATTTIRKQFGNDAICALEGEEAVQAIPVVSTGSLGLDLALGVGGLPRGRVVEIFGPESSGKTTLALSAIAEAQRAGGVCAFVDVEHALDVVYAKRLGVDLGSLLVSQPDCGEQALEIVDQLARTGAVDVVVMDSVAALVPRAEVEGEMGDAHAGLQARLMSQALRKVTAVTSKQNCLVIFTNQLRHRQGIVFGNPETTTGGNALKFYASVRLDIRKVGQIQEGDQAVGVRVRVKVVKSKVSPPFREAEFGIRWGQGIDRVGEALDVALKYGLLRKEGDCYYAEGQHVGTERVLPLWVSFHLARIREKVFEGKE